MITSKNFIESSITYPTLAELPAYLAAKAKEEKKKSKPKKERRSRKP